MKKTLAIIATALVVPAFASADNVGGCGWGTKLFDGQGGIAPQVLAVTTNGTSGNQTFAITSGTSGCTQDGVVRTNWKTAAFIDSNMNKLARDMSRGEGESLDALAALVGVDAADKDVFASALQTNFGTIFTAESDSDAVRAAIHGVLARDAKLARYAASV